MLLGGGEPLVIDDDLLRQWLEALPTELDLRWKIGPRVPEFGNNDRFGVVTPSPGAGLTLEGVNLVAGFQLRMVARELDYSKLKLTAYQIHAALLFADIPAMLWGTWVTSIATAGGEPVPEPADGRDLDRVAFTCTYLAEVGL